MVGIEERLALNSWLCATAVAAVRMLCGVSRRNTAPLIPAHLNPLQQNPPGPSAVLFCVLLVFLCGVCTATATASGAWAPEAVFETMATPEPGRLNSYLKGDIGVLRRDYPLLYLWAAQRALRGHPLDANEIALARSVQLSMQSEIGGSEDGFSYWRRVRSAYAQASNTLMPPDIEVFGTLTESEADSSFLNCQDDAFYTAGKHLDELRLRADASPDATPAGASVDVLALRVAGRASAEGWLLDWVRGQDAV